jgi:hypothetical protein
MRIFVLSSHKPVPAAPAASSTAIPAAAMPRRNAPVVMFVLPSWYRSVVLAETL